MKISKRAQQGLQGTPASQTVQNLGAQIKGLLDKLTPMMQDLQASIPEINNALQQIQQLETQVSQLEQMSEQVQQQAEQAKQPAQSQQADDSCEDGVPAFWRRNLDYGSR